MPVIQPLRLPKKSKTFAQMEQDRYEALADQAKRERRRARSRAAFRYISSLLGRH